MDEKPTISETAAERMCDARVQSRLLSSAAYRNAENSSEQAKVEQQIADEEWAYIESQYRIA